MSSDPLVHVGVAGWVFHPVTDQILMLQRSPHAVHGGGKWSVPGGWIDYGETPEQAVIREVFEETGLTVEKPELIGVVANTWQTVGHVICIHYSIETIIGSSDFNNKEPDKHVRMAWSNIMNFGEDDLFAPVWSILKQHNGTDHA